MESGFEDDFAPMQSSNGTVDDPPLILANEQEESPQKNSEVDAVGDDPNSTASSDLSLSVSKHVEPREDPEVIKQWKEDQVKMLEDKDKAEEKAKEELKEQAKRELEDWYKQHSEQVSLQKLF